MDFVRVDLNAPFFVCSILYPLCDKISAQHVCVSVSFSLAFISLSFTLPQDNTVLVNALLAYQCKVCNVYRSHEWLACWRYFRSFSRLSIWIPGALQTNSVWQWFWSSLLSRLFCVLHWKYQTNCATFTKKFIHVFYLKSHFVWCFHLLFARKNSPSNLMLAVLWTKFLALLLCFVCVCVWSWNGIRMSKEFEIGKESSSL